MSRTPKHSNIGQERSNVPRAVIHKQILDAAEVNPDGSIVEIASEVSGASPNLVEQVFEEYGDPVDDVQDPGEGHVDTLSQETSSAKGKPSQNMKELLNGEELNDQQYETLLTIYEYPNATQRELADRFEVTSATINQRVNSIEGFEWGNREEFVNSLFENVDTETMSQDRSTLSQQDHQTNEELIEHINELTETVQELHSHVQMDSPATEVLFDDAELTHKILHACLDSELITEEEELQILQTLFNYS